MTLSAAASVFLTSLLSVQVIHGVKDWGVTYRSPQICAVKGSTVEIRCSFWFPSRIKNQETRLQRTLWFTKMNGDDPVELTSDPQYSGRVSQSCEDKICTLTLRDVKESDWAQFKFMFTTNQEGGPYTGEPGVTLTVTELQVQVEEKSPHSNYIWGKLMCRSSCLLPDHLYIWYKNGKRIPSQTSSHYSGYLSATDSFSCAVEGHEDFPSPSMCAVGQSCSRVTYSDRSICAPKGSSVDISCTYNSYYGLTSKLWFIPERGLQWQSPSQPEDLSTDSQYGGRVQVLDPGSGLSTLRITDLRERDSAQYRFRFIRGSFEWRSSLPGTTLTVTALQVQVTRVTVHQSVTEAELKCQSSCRPAGPLSYIWYKNGERIHSQTSSSYQAWFSPEDSVSCALEGHENFSSPSLSPGGRKPPSVSVSPSGEIVEGSSVTLTCSSDANPAAKYTWYKENGNFNPVRTGPQLVFSSIQSSDSGQYYCTAENNLERRTSEHTSIHVKYAPRHVSLTSSGEIVEGSSVTLTCSSDANPAATYTWYRNNQTLMEETQSSYKITSISVEHNGNYHCKSENDHGKICSTPLHIDVQYAPRHVSLTSSGEIVEGSSVTLTCSSDANPAATYTWSRNNQTLMEEKQSIYKITSISVEHSGNYHCKSENDHGKICSTPLHIDVQYPVKSVVGWISAAVLAVIFLSAFLIIRSKKSSKQTTEQQDSEEQVNMDSAAEPRRPPEEDRGHYYASVAFFKKQEDPLYSNIRSAQLDRSKTEEKEDDNVECSVVKFQHAAASPQ